MKTFFAALMLLTASVAHAASTGADQITQAQYEAGQARVLADAKPLGGNMTLADSKGFAWEVTEVNGILKLTRYLKPDGTPVCAPEHKAN
ncbi:hypothetical protein AL053_00760 [Pseudomonas savastanoi pv. fraxini]|uniref:hypothetical protein n=1 Tax=Pseudomonas savastanoi TaxID=29438 RepID=UPI00073A125C|nr:hypothetical protein [Pseudomonas savastanoi]KUG40596.1 hypothetical protein ALP79_200223 [Pseudomonas savastanoi pv. fraxini]KWS64607.1 hypothetical protein AL053_00760 [Pseudomonas savastanoi pv. fraxini]